MSKIGSRTRQLDSKPTLGTLFHAGPRFYSLLDEQQRRLYAGLESMKLGNGGDSVLAEFLGLDPHTIARGRRQLLDQDVEVGRIRRSGAGRKPVEKKRPK
jgi:hypothetical protein